MGVVLGAGPRGSPARSQQAPAPRAHGTGRQVTPLSVQLPVAAFRPTAHVASGPLAECELRSAAAPRLLDFADLTFVADGPDIAARKPHGTRAGGGEPCVASADGLKFTALTRAPSGL